MLFRDCSLPAISYVADSRSSESLLQAPIATRVRWKMVVASSKHDNDCVSWSVAFHSDSVWRVVRVRLLACLLVNATLLLAGISRRTPTHRETDLFASEHSVNVYVSIRSTLIRALLPIYPLLEHKLARTSVDATRNTRRMRGRDRGIFPPPIRIINNNGVWTRVFHRGFSVDGWFYKVRIVIADEGKKVIRAREMR